MNENNEHPKYYPPVGSCDYDEHENDMYYIGDYEGDDT
jgi:hypothetical protein